MITLPMCYLVDHKLKISIGIGRVILSVFNSAGIEQKITQEHLWKFLIRSAENRSLSSVDRVARAICWMIQYELSECEYTDEIILEDLSNGDEYLEADDL